MGEVYAGLDISDKSTQVCAVDGSGGVIWNGACPTDPETTDPETIAATLKRRAPGLMRVILETGPLSAFLYHGLVERGVPVVCVCARHAHGVLSARVNKSDVHDAEGLAQMARTGWFKAIHIKDEASHLDRAALKIRAQLVEAHRAMSGQLRGLLKLFGLRLGRATTAGKRRERLEALFALRSDLRGLLAPLIEGIEALEVQIIRSSKALAAAAAADPVAARLMSAPGVGPICALTFKSAIEDPGRFARGEDVGAFAGLAPRRSQSGEKDVRGRISKAGDPMLRSALYEAANSLLSRVKRPCALREWGLGLVQRKGSKRARVAVARKLAILLHRLWQSEDEFRWA